MDNKYNIIIIGSGISGLYSALKIKKTSPNKSFLLLEKYGQNWVGGRTNNELFYETQIVTGAGIGRKKKDKLLIKLLSELDIPFTEYKSQINFSNLFIPLDIVEYVNKLKKILAKKPELEKKTFADAFVQEFGCELYRRFVISSGYSDYENAGVKETLYHYGMEDNQSGWIGLHIPWKNMIEKMVSKIGKKHFKFSSEVIHVNKLQENPCLFEIKLKNNIVYYANKVIVATTISGIKQIIPNASDKNSLYQQIHGQPFLRLYGKFDKKSSIIMKEYVSSYTIVPGPLQKIIPIDINKGVYMISYSDNTNALVQKNYLGNTEKNRQLFCKLIEQSLGIPSGSLYLIAIKEYYWPIGTHFFEPLEGDFLSREQFINNVQHPEKGLLVVGEAVAIHQGWVEGALESVKNVLTQKWIKNEC
jgi:hypothetical protein